jgi:hypothetical protein
MMADGYKTRDDFLDAFFDHVFGDGEVDDEDQEWFNEKVASFFPEDSDDNKDKGGSGSGANAPRRRPASSGSGSTTHRRKRQSANAGSSGYGSKSYWGK